MRRRLCGAALNAPSGSGPASSTPGCSERRSRPSSLPLTRETPLRKPETPRADALDSEVEMLADDEGRNCRVPGCVPGSELD